MHVLKVVVCATFTLLSFLDLIYFCILLSLAIVFLCSVVDDVIMLLSIMP